MPCLVTFYRFFSPPEIYPPNQMALNNKTLPVLSNMSFIKYVICRMVEFPGVFIKTCVCHFLDFCNVLCKRFIASLRFLSMEHKDSMVTQKHENDAK
jgi:hypothetical protein